ncbi:hypothetical protein [Chengkuizengella axinellae]|uniref:Uncharacterized protein n=1 Tax=Chengkuizengella axinellae TaxID=3064388 RepID=A0ABT9J598_9BACL|nr:hypothetical protein [Chengkuizengella sp. 2205SS18-9]MDP5276791.1 hypothetical protein [Chengkuizengella sp. 2205SS18-9]
MKGFKKFLMIPALVAAVTTGGVVQPTAFAEEIVNPNDLVDYGDGVYGDTPSAELLTPLYDLVDSTPGVGLESEYASEEQKLIGQFDYVPIKLSNVPLNIELFSNTLTDLEKQLGGDTNPVMGYIYGNGNKERGVDARPSNYTFTLDGFHDNYRRYDSTTNGPDIAINSDGVAVQMAYASNGDSNLNFNIGRYIEGINQFEWKGGSSRDVASSERYKVKDGVNVVGKRPEVIFLNDNTLLEVHIKDGKLKYNIGKLITGNTIDDYRIDWAYHGDGTSFIDNVNAATVALGLDMNDHGDIVLSYSGNSSKKLYIKTAHWDNSNATLTWGAKYAGNYNASTGTDVAITNAGEVIAVYSDFGQLATNKVYYDSLKLNNDGTLSSIRLHQKIGDGQAPSLAINHGGQVVLTYKNTDHDWASETGDFSVYQSVGQLRKANDGIDWYSQKTKIGYEGRQPDINFIDDHTVVTVFKGAKNDRAYASVAPLVPTVSSTDVTLMINPNSKIAANSEIYYSDSYKKIGGPWFDDGSGHGQTQSKEYTYGFTVGESKELAKTVGFSFSETQSVNLTLNPEAIIDIDLGEASFEESVTREWSDELSETASSSFETYFETTDSIEYTPNDIENGHFQFAFYQPVRTLTFEPGSNLDQAKKKLNELPIFKNKVITIDGSFNYHDNNVQPVIIYYPSN